RHVNLSATAISDGIFCGAAYQWHSVKFLLEHQKSSSAFWAVHIFVGNTSLALLAETYNCDRFICHFAISLSVRAQQNDFTCYPVTRISKDKYLTTRNKQFLKLKFWVMTPTY